MGFPGKSDWDVFLLFFSLLFYALNGFHGIKWKRIKRICGLFRNLYAFEWQLQKSTKNALDTDLYCICVFVC